MSGIRAHSRDILASVVVFLVALPLCLGIAIASGAPPMSGLMTGIIGGIVVGLLAGAPLQVSGPAAGLVALVYEIIVEYGIPGLGIILLAAGFLQMLAGYFKLGQWFRAMSPAVIQGMLAGIGVLIVASQFHVMLDVKPESTGLANLATIPETILKGLFPPEDGVHHWAALTGTISMAVILAWNLLPSRFKLIPGTLVAVLVGVALTAILQLPISYVDVPGQFMEAITLPNAQSLALLGNPDVWVMVLTIAIVASAETMLSASALEKMLAAQALEGTRPQPERTDFDKEMLAQGVGNTLCGLVGALPMTGVIVRSSANIQAGALTRWSTVLHGVWILGLVAFFPFLLEKIPTASLAAILVYTGYKLVQPAVMRKLWQQGRGEFLIYAVTLSMVVATNLLEGVIAGTVLALLRLLYTFSRLDAYTVSNGEGVLEVFLKGSATFISLPKLVTILDSQPQGKTLRIHVEHLSHIDHACMEQLHAWQEQYRATGGTVTVEWAAWTEKMSASSAQTPA